MVNHELEAQEQWVPAQDVLVGDTVHGPNSPAEWKSPLRNSFVNSDGYVVLQLENGMDLTFGPEDMVAVTRPVEAPEEE
jgi:hypothetical protein